MLQKFIPVLYTKWWWVYRNGTVYVLFRLHQSAITKPFGTIWHNLAPIEPRFEGPMMRIEGPMMRIEISMNGSQGVTAFIFISRRDTKPQVE